MHHERSAGAITRPEHYDVPPHHGRQSREARGEERAVERLAERPGPHVVGVAARPERGARGAADGGVGVVPLEGNPTVLQLADVRQLQHRVLVARRPGPPAKAVSQDNVRVGWGV